MNLKICLSGATGHVGQELIKGILRTSDIEIVACIGFSSAGKQLANVLSFPCPDLFIHNSVKSALEQQPFDVLIDYTTPGSVYQTVIDCISNGIHCVVGTSGLSDEQYTNIHDLTVLENNGTQVHSVRVPGYYSSSEAVFGLPGERLSIRHDSISYAPYVEGTLLAAKKVCSMKGLVRGMSKLLRLDAI